MCPVANQRAHGTAGLRAFGDITDRFYPGGA
jgi:hypothetical protein